MAGNSLQRVHLDSEFFICLFVSWYTDTSGKYSSGAGIILWKIFNIQKAPQWQARQLFFPVVSGAELLYYSVSRIPWNGLILKEECFDVSIKTMMFPGIFSSHLMGCSETKKPQLRDSPYGRTVEAGVWEPWETCFSSPPACLIGCQVPAKMGTTSCEIMVIFRQNWWFLLEDLSGWKTNVLCKIDEKCISLQLRIFRARMTQIYSPKRQILFHISEDARTSPAAW